MLFDGQLFQDVIHCFIIHASYTFIQFARFCSEGSTWVACEACLLVCQNSGYLLVDSRAVLLVGRVQCF